MNKKTACKHNKIGDFMEFNAIEVLDVIFRALISLVALFLLNCWEKNKFHNYHYLIM